MIEWLIYLQNDKVNCFPKILSRAKPAIGGEAPVIKKIKGKGSPLVEDYLDERDYVGAITLLEVINSEHIFTMNV